MALSSTPSLTQINTELGTTGQSLVTCIANAGKTGTWTKQSDFAGYSAESISVNPNFELVPSSLQVSSTKLTATGNWSVRTPYSQYITSVSSSGVAGTDLTVKVFLQSNPLNQLRNITVIWELDSDTNIYATFSITHGGIS